MNSTLQPAVARSLGIPRWQRHLDAVQDAQGTRQALVGWLGSLRVGELMGQPAICVDSQIRLTDARQVMSEHAVRRLPVVDDGRLVGILTLGDVRGAWPSEVTTLNRFELDYLINQVKVERAMTREVIAVTPETSLVDAARLMIEHKIGGLPVLSDGGHVVGVVTESDIFRALVSLIEIDDDSRSGPDRGDESVHEGSKELP